jgi:hypothetical protein
MLEVLYEPLGLCKIHPAVEGIPSEVVAMGINTFV